MHRILEYTNHLSNVLTVISDKKLYNSTSERYSSQVVSTSDYYPFGLSMYGKQYDSGRYRFGFNGKENDTEYGSSQLVQDYGFRIYNPSIGRFLSVDPISSYYPELTPYQFASNRPIDGVDLDGLEYTKSTNEETGNVKHTPHLNIYVSQKAADNLTQEELGARAAQIKVQFEKTVQGSVKGRSGTIEHTSELTYSFVTARDLLEKGIPSYMVLFQTHEEVQADRKRLSIPYGGPVSGFVEELGNPNSNIVHISVYDEAEKTARSVSDVGVTGTHEVLHTAGLRHPTEDGTSASILWSHLTYAMGPNGVKKGYSIKIRDEYILLGKEGMNKFQKAYDNIMLGRGLMIISLQKAIESKEIYTDPQLMLDLIDKKHNKANTLVPRQLSTINGNPSIRENEK